MAGQCGDTRKAQENESDVTRIRAADGRFLLRFPRCSRCCVRTRFAHQQRASSRSGGASQHWPAETGRRARPSLSLSLARQCAHSSTSWPDVVVVTGQVIELTWWERNEAARSISTEHKASNERRRTSVETLPLGARSKPPGSRSVSRSLAVCLSFER